MRRLFLTASLALVGAALARPLEAQFTFGAQGAYMTGLEEVSSGADWNGTKGLGARVQLSPPIPLLSLALIGQGVYYFPEGDSSYQTYGLGAKVGLGIPIISPYGIAGWQWRRKGNGTTTTESGLTAGLGVSLSIPAVPFDIFLEGTMEFNDEIAAAPDFDNNPLVIQAGVMLGG